MTSHISHTSVDCRDAYALSRFWGAVLGYDGMPGEPDEPGDEECLLVSPDGAIRLLFIEVPESKSTKNRVHLDLEPVDGTREEEIERLLGLGATLLADRRRPDGGWATLADPEGNEFCVLRTRAEREATGGL
ncbi:VOC family protein [Nocardioides sp. CFH 31398]|uniref:VOC family protein n=1 Tax=Nocardioides sp. CFH 31398 TaxID=2919579 RepID=UPI001F053AB0|nr:VOC family protein [Nocardioides sp. CFH 31398]MCH1869042.1 VOC family protein [Nocardioides sp. CFH 31398]